jgi:hypothetical protein
VPGEGRPTEAASAVGPPGWLVRQRSALIMSAGAESFRSGWSC